MNTTTAKSPSLIAYQVDRNRSGKAYWNRIGAAWPNKAGGLQVKLSTLPIDGELILIPPKRDDASQPATGATGETA